MKSVCVFCISLFVLSSLIVANSQAQTPQSFKYQAKARDLNGNVLDNQEVSIKVSILEGSSSGTVVFSELFNVVTNSLGLVNLNIGKGTLLNGKFSSINWGNGNHFLELQLDISGGNNFILMGVTQLLSVPYALNAGNVNNKDTSSTNELQYLTISNDTIFLSEGGFMELPEDKNTIYTAGSDIKLTGTVIENTAPGIKSYTQSQIDGLSVDNGVTVHNSTTNCLNYYSNGSWFELCDKSPAFICGDSLLDSRDGQYYKTVKIGVQCWMAENLNIGTMINTSSEQTNNGTSEKYCYNNSTSYCDIYGGFYQWDEMMNYDTSSGTITGICPDGWHVSMDSDWKELEIYLGMSQSTADEDNFRGTDQGSKLKETGTVHWDSPNSNATNESGFTALPGGYRNQLTVFGGIGYEVCWWSPIKGNTSNKRRILRTGYSNIYRGHYYKTIGQYVRCVKY